MNNLEQVVKDAYYQHMWRRPKSYRKNRRYSVSYNARLVLKRKADNLLHYTSEGKRLPK